jgi:hypothetical protein
MIAIEVMIRRITLHQYTKWWKYQSTLKVIHAVSWSSGLLSTLVKQSKYFKCVGWFHGCWWSIILKVSRKEAYGRRIVILLVLDNSATLLAGRFII